MSYTHPRNWPNDQPFTASSYVDYNHRGIGKAELWPGPQPMPNAPPLDAAALERELLYPTVEVREAQTADERLDFLIEYLHLGGKV